MIIQSTNDEQDICANCTFKGLGMCDPCPFGVSKDESLKEDSDVAAENILNQIHIDT